MNSRRNQVLAAVLLAVLAYGVSVDWHFRISPVIPRASAGAAALRRKLGFQRLEGRRMVTSTFYVDIGKHDAHTLSESQVLKAIDDSLVAFESAADIDFVVGSGRRPHFTISSRSLHIGGGAYARGQVPSAPGDQIWFADGWVAHRSGRPVSPWLFAGFWAGNPDALNRVLQHEMGHALMGWVHTSNAACIMTIDVGPGFCQAEIDSLVRRFGEAIQPPVYSWYNGLDVNDDGRVSALDALVVINAIGILFDPRVEPDAFYDVSDDGEVTGHDALLVINHIDRIMASLSRT